MENVDHEGSGENTDDLISAEVDEVVDGFGLVPLAVSHEHSGRLLDAIDAQLSHLHTQSRNKIQPMYSKRFASLGDLDQRLSLSKDTGLGSTVPTNYKTSSTPSEGKDDAERPKVDDGLHSPSRSEQCRWRLEKLLGKSSEVAGIPNEEDKFTMDSICTEDFSTRFRDEMLDLSDKAPDVPIIRSDNAKTLQPHRSPHERRKKSSLKHLIGIPVQSFDSVTIDTDLDTVCSETVRQHLKSVPINRTGPAFRLSRENALNIRPDVQRNTQSLSSDDEGTFEETSGEGSIRSNRYSRGRRHPSGRKGKRWNSHQNRRNGFHMKQERPKDKTRIDIDQLRELRLSLAKLQQQKIAAVQSLERIREEMDQTKKEQNSLQMVMRNNKAQAQNIRCELHRLQAQRDVCLEQVRILKEKQVTLVQQQKTLQGTHKCKGSSVSVLEREEMDRLLNNAKSELFSEQRRFRDTLDSMQERLDEVNQELEQKDDGFRALQHKCSDLEKQLADTVREREYIKESSQKDLKQQVSRFQALERTVAQKELQVRGLEEEKNALHLELCSINEKQKLKLTEIDYRTKKEKEQEISQLTLRLTKRHQEELQMVRKQADELRSAALAEQAQTHKQSQDFCIQIKDEEIKRLKAALEHHKDQMRKQTEEHRRETQDEIAKALKQEEKKWEAQKEKALREQRGILEEQTEEAVKRERVEVEKERKNTLAMQTKVTQLQKQAERDAAHLKENVQRSEQELQNLMATISEKDQKHQRRAARHERQNKSWAQDIHTECFCLQELLKQNNASFESKHLPDSPTMPEALQTLQSLTKATQQLINVLKNEISSQRRTALQLSHDKEQELCLQKEQLREEMEQALASLKGKLIKEHMKEISRTKPHTDDDNTGGLFARLRKQLQAKDDELRLVQRNITEWKDKTTARLAHKFQQELMAELERRVPNPQGEQQKRLERLENEMRHLTTQFSSCRDSEFSSAAVSDFPRSSSTKDLTSYKLLQHIQSRIHHLQGERQTQCPSLMKGNRDATNLGGSYLDTIAPAQERLKKKSCSPARNICS